MRVVEEDQQRTAWGFDYGRFLPRPKASEDLSAPPTLNSHSLARRLKRLTLSLSVAEKLPSLAVVLPRFPGATSLLLRSPPASRPRPPSLILSALLSVAIFSGRVVFVEVRKKGRKRARPSSRRDEEETRAADKQRTATAKTRVPINLCIAGNGACSYDWPCRRV